MSFILDALRKSESERQRSAAPTLARTPQAAHSRASVPLWTWLVMAALSIALVAAGFAWLSDRPTAPVAEPVADHLAAADTAATRLPRARAPTPLPPTAESAGRTQLPAAASVTDSRAASPLAGGALPPGDTVPPGDTRTLRPASDIAALDPSLPRYTLELLAYNGTDPESGYAWINGRRYFPGERIGSGPELVAVRADGVLLAYRGETFLLRQR